MPKTQTKKKVQGKTGEKLSTAFDVLKGAAGYKNRMQAPRIEKVVVGVGVGRVSDKNQRELIRDRLANITGQRAALRGAKQSIASFKLRQGDVVGYQVTLRGERMLHFLDKLIHVALPRTRDFRGLKVSSTDEMGNYTLGIKEHSVFPETADEELKDVFGMAITVVTGAKNKKEAHAYLAHLGIEAKRRSIPILEILRGAEIPVYHSLAYDQIGPQMAIVKSLNIPWLLLMGHKEALANEVAVRNIKTNAQDSVPVSELAAYLHRKHVVA